MKNLLDGLSVKIMSDLILKKIYGRYGTKNLTEEQIRRYKMTERKIYKKYDSLSENELNKKSNKKVYVKKDVMIFVIKHCRGEKKRSEKRMYGFRKKLMIPESEISEWSEHKVKSKIGNIFVNEKILR